MASLLKEYCQSSSIHGLHYVSATGRPLLERALWLSLLLAAAVLLVANVWNSYLAVYSGPVQIIVEHPRYPLYKLDFPAVTICSNNKVMKSKVEALTFKLFGNSTTYDMQKQFHNTLKVFSYLRFPLYNHPYMYLKDINHNTYPINKNDIVAIMEQVAPSIDDMMSFCYWRGTNFNCSNLFRRQVTEEGFCYSFNSKTAERNNRYSARNPPFSAKNGTLIALRSNSAGRTTGLEVNVKSLEHEHLDNDIVTRGYSVIVHSPDNYPEVSQSLMITKTTYNLYQIAVTLSTTHADSSLFRLDESIRGCSFRHEIIEKDVDTLLTNCPLFCRMNAIIFYCQCVPYYFVNISDAEICGIEHLKCLHTINVRLRNTNMSTKVPGFPEWSLPLTMNCSCKQPCSYVSYSAEMRQSIENTGNKITHKKLYLNEDFAAIDVFYRDMWAISYTRQAKFGMRDFIVGVGSMAGLLLGCSLVSVVELVYYLFRYFYHKTKPVIISSPNPKVNIIYVQPFVN